MSQNSRLPILEITTLTVVVFASVFAVVPGADEMLLKLLNGRGSATGDSDIGSRITADDTPQVLDQVPEAKQLKVQPVTFPTRVDQKSSKDFDRNKPTPFQGFTERSPVSGQLEVAESQNKSNIKSVDSRPKNNQLSIDPFEELNDSEFQKMQKASLDADQKVSLATENHVTTVVQDEIDWELELDTPNAGDDQAAIAVDAAAPSHQPYTETADESPAKIMVPDLQSAPKSEAMNSSSGSQVPDNSARLFDAVSPSVFQRFDFERGQIVVNSTLRNDPDIKLSAVQPFGPGSENSVARIVNTAGSARTQKNPTLGAEFDWNEYIFSDLPGNGRSQKKPSERVVRAPTQSILNPGGHSPESFQQLPPQNVNSRQASVLVPTPASPVGERVSRQPMSSRAMQQDNTFSPIR